MFAGLATLLLLAGGVVVTARAARTSRTGPRVEGRGVLGVGVAGLGVAGLGVAVATCVAALAEDPLLAAAVAPVFGLVVGAAGPSSPDRTTGRDAAGCGAPSSSRPPPHSSRASWTTRSH